MDGWLAGYLKEPGPANQPPHDESSVLRKGVAVMGRAKGERHAPPITAKGKTVLASGGSYLSFFQWAGQTLLSVTGPLKEGKNRTSQDNQHTLNHYHPAHYLFFL